MQLLGQSSAASALMMQRLLGTGYELHPLGSRKAETTHILGQQNKLLMILCCSINSRWVLLIYSDFIEK